MKPEKPSNILAEKNVLGFIISTGNFNLNSINKLKKEHFYKPEHKLIFSAISSLTEKNQKINLNSVATFLQSQNYLEEVGGEDYLIQITKDDLPDKTEIEYFAEFVLDKWVARKMLEVSQSISNNCSNGNLITSDLIGLAEEKILKISKSIVNNNSFRKIGDVITETIQELENPKKGRPKKLKGLDTGFTGLNEFTEGLHNGELTIIAAVQAMGKTSFAINLMENVARKNRKGVAYFSLDLSTKQITQQMMVSTAGIEPWKIRENELTPRDWASFLNRASVIKKLDIFIDDSNLLSANEIYAKSKILKSENPNLGLIIVDSIQLVNSVSSNTENENKKIVYILNCLKKLAVEIDVPIVALSRLTSTFNNDNEMGGRPKIEESSNLTENADNLIIIYRPEYYFFDNPKYQGYAELIIAKQKNGPKGIIRLSFFKKFGSFESSPLENSFEYDDVKSNKDINYENYED